MLSLKKLLSMKKIFGLIPVLLTLLFVSCSDSDEPNAKDLNSPLLFTLESISNSKDISYEYYSPDPGCGIQKKYYIYANNSVSELVLKCENFDEIYFDMPQADTYPQTQYTSDELNAFTAVITDGNILTIKFDKTAYPDPIPELDLINNYVPLMVWGVKDGKYYQDILNIIRTLNDNDLN